MIESPGRRAIENGEINMLIELLELYGRIERSEDKKDRCPAQSEL